MTTDEAITEAQRRPGTDTLAVWVRETLTVSEACGWPEPAVITKFVTWVELGLEAMTVDEVRSLVVMWLRAADEAAAFEKQPISDR